MSVGAHLGEDDEADTEGLAKVSKLAWFKAALGVAFKVNHDFDLPYVGGISKDGRTVYIDRHFPRRVAIGKQLVDLSPGLIRHEQVEGALLRHGWLYEPAHHIANAAENKVYEALGLDPEKAGKAYGPYIKRDRLEKLVKVPVDLNLHPYRDPPTDRKLLKRLLAVIRTGLDADGGKAA